MSPNSPTRIKDRFASILVIAGSIIAAVLLAQDEDINQAFNGYCGLCWAGAYDS